MSASAAPMTASQALTPSILKKWRAQSQDVGFIRFVDKNKGNCAVTNLVFVTLAACMLHFDDWVTDWDCELTEEEAALVREPGWRQGLKF